MMISHHGGWATLSRSCNQTVGTVPKNSQRSVSACQCHIVGLPTVLGTRDGATEVETPFLIVRIMRDGRMDVFATGCYRDKVQANGDGSLRFAERVVVCDGSRFDTLVAIPF